MLEPTPELDEEDEGVDREGDAEEAINAARERAAAPFAADAEDEELDAEDGVARAAPSHGALNLMDVLQCMVIGKLRPQVLSRPRSLALTHVCAPLPPLSHVQPSGTGK